MLAFSEETESFFVFSDFGDEVLSFIVDIILHVVILFGEFVCLSLELGLFVLEEGNELLVDEGLLTAITT